MTFKQKLSSVTAPKALGLCVGLDPDPDRLPDPFSPDLEGIASFLHEVITATAPYAAAYKVNTAFYEAWGSQGWALLETIADTLPESALRIVDAKRGDIGNTARRYAQAFLQRLPFDAITLSPYMGGDTLQPFLENPEKGAFVLALTTNPGSRDLQHFSDGDTTLYHHVLQKIPEWAEHGNLGAVVGATHPSELILVRRDYPHIPLLIPGIGAQGGDVDVVTGFADDLEGAPVLVNISRGLLYPQYDLEFPENVKQACLNYRSMLNISPGRKKDETDD
jgi:orotidine-5'-phosphate decarboxylase